MDEFRLTLDAESDLIEIYIYGTTEFGIRRAERYAADLDRAFRLLAENPTFGADYRHVREGVRRSECGSHSIYYRPDGARILILRVLHKRMDPARHL